jgi:hypothetical protein
MFTTLKATQSEYRQKIHNQLGWVILRLLIVAIIVYCGGFEKGVNQIVVILELLLGI